jgi:ribosomal protein S18 acetylase RimI-like enzyme
MTQPPGLADVRALLDERERTFTALDELLPLAGPPPAGEPLRAADASAFGVVEHSESPPGTLSSLWSAREVWQLYPIVPAAHPAALDALLLAWREKPVRPEGADSARTVVWPSRDVDAAGVLLDHGFDPVSVLAVRSGRGARAEPGSRAPSDLRLRRAESADLPVLVDLAVAELDYSSRIGGARRRPDAAELRSAALRYRLAAGEPVWLAEDGGDPLGMAECSLADVAAAGAPRALLQAGRWGYVNCLSVFPAARGHGVGGALARAALRDFAARRAEGSYLYYNPLNPRSSVFWPRYGYRPLWTIWEAAPASGSRA